MMPSLLPRSCRPIAHRRLHPRAISGGGVGDAAREVDHEADRRSALGIDEAGAGPRHPDAVRRGHADVDVADVDGAAHERDQLGQLLEQGGRPLGRAIGDGDLAGPGGSIGCGVAGA